ncbi:MAG: M20 family metallo-hydrolase [Azospirillaceae bacterium]
MAATTTEAPAPRVNGNRLIARLRELARIGGRPDGGVNRQAFSTEDAAARTLVVDWARAAGLAASTDEIGNLFLRHEPPGSEGQLPILSGSHLDSQPMGGWLDGVYGVIAALEAVESLKEQAIALARPVEVVAWSNEEGSRFAPGVMGSAVYAGHVKLSEIADNRDPAGTRLADALKDFLAATPDLPVHDHAQPIAGLVEAHIEQGPILENEGRTIGVVEAVQGIRWLEVTVRGEAAHAGTAPLRGRRDALLAATSMVQAMNEALYDPDDVIRFTVGRFIVEPGSPNTVADRVLFTIDLRHPDAGVLKTAVETLRRVATETAPPCTAAVKVLETLEPVRFDEAIVAAVASASEALGLPGRRIVSGAGHDAAQIAPHYPAGMIFVPCHKGISHNPAENADESDLIAGADVLAGTLARLAGR